MKIICGCCKKIIDTEKHDFCPKCGANFNYSQALNVNTNTQQYEENQERINEERRNAVENKVNKRVRNTPAPNNSVGKKNGKGGCCAGCFVALVIFFSVGVAVISDLSDEFDFESMFEEIHDTYTDPEYTTTDDYKKPDESKPEDIVTEDTKPEEKPEEKPDVRPEITNPDNFILTGETAYADDYSVTCTEVSFYESMIATPPEGVWYVAFDITIKNTTEKKQFYYPSIKCFVDDTRCNVLYLTGMFMPGELEADEEYSKRVIFEVPEDSIYFDIYVGDEVAIFTSIADIESLNPEHYN